MPSSSINFVFIMTQVNSSLRHTEKRASSVDNRLLPWSGGTQHHLRGGGRQRAQGGNLSEKHIFATFRPILKSSNSVYFGGSTDRELGARKHFFGKCPLPHAPCGVTTVTVFIRPLPSWHVDSPPGSPNSWRKKKTGGGKCLVAKVTEEISGKSWL